MQFEFILSIAPFIPIILAILGYLKWIWNPENRAKSELFVLKGLRRVGIKRFDKSTISAQTAAFMVPRIGELNEENPEMILPVAKIEFSKSLNERTRMKNGELYIRLHDSSEEGKNLVRIAEEYVRRGIMNEGRRITPPPIEKAVDLTIMHRLVSASDDALKVLHEVHIDACRSEEDTLQALEKTSYVDEVGYLTRLFLPELELVAKRIGFAIRPNVIGETREWLDFVYPIAQKCDNKPEVHTRDVDLILKGENYGVGVVLVARASVVAAFGTKPHERWIWEYLDNPEIKDIYILGHGAENCYDTLRVVGSTYLDERISGVGSSFYRTKSRGRENVPVVLVRYAKGDLIDESKKRKTIQRFLRETQKALPRIKARNSDVIAWCRRNVEYTFGPGKYVSKYDCRKITDALSQYKYTTDDLDRILGDQVIDESYQEFLQEQRISYLYPHEEILFKIHSAGGANRKKVIQLLKSDVMKNHAIQLSPKVES